jgi:hypothetical protein
MCVLHCKIYSCVCLRVVGKRGLLELACVGGFCSYLCCWCWKIRNTLEHALFGTDTEQCVVAVELN